MFHPKGPTFFELARQALSSTQQGYDLLAEKFDYTPFRTPDWLLSMVAARLRDSNPYESLLDVCCGTGAAIGVFAPQCRQRIVGIDISAEMLKVAQKKIGSLAGPADCTLVRGDVLEMSFEEEFDLAVCFGAFGHILSQDEPRFVDRIRQALRPGGRFVFVTSYMPSKWSRTYWMCRCFNAAMHVRNWMVSPPFVMYYLTFMLPEAKQLLEDHGFHVQIDDPFVRPLDRLRMVLATRK